MTITLELAEIARLRRMVAVTAVEREMIPRRTRPLRRRIVDAWPH